MLAVVRGAAGGAGDEIQYSGRQEQSRRSTGGTGSGEDKTGIRLDRLRAE